MVVTPSHNEGNNSEGGSEHAKDDSDTIASRENHYFTTDCVKGAVANTGRESAMSDYRE